MAEVFREAEDSASGYDGALCKTRWFHWQQLARSEGLSKTSYLKYLGAAHAAKTWGANREKRPVHCGELNILCADFLLGHFSDFLAGERAWVAKPNYRQSQRAGMAKFKPGPAKAARSWRSKVPERKEVQRGKFTLSTSLPLDIFSDS